MMLSGDAATGTCNKGILHAGSLWFCVLSSGSEELTTRTGSHLCNIDCLEVSAHVLQGT